MHAWSQENALAFQFFENYFSPSAKQAQISSKFLTMILSFHLDKTEAKEDSPSTSVDDHEDHIEPVASTLDVNSKQNSVFKDKDNDEIEDLAPIDGELKKEMDDVDKHGDDMKPVAHSGNFMQDHILNEPDDDKGDEYDEEFEENGHHYKKHVKKGDGFK